MSVMEKTGQGKAQLLRFVVVGCTAALVHWGVVKLAVEQAGLRPLLANVLGWSIAFGVSYGGHRRWTFSATRGQRSSRSALPRFLLVSATGFLLNEAAYATALQWPGVRYDLALAVVLVLVAGFTFVMSRWWAFRAST